ncbi:hypothetical protein [Chryseobacterium nepalense]|uniref:Uncharacterized protein n=1 Tax=Chryseobacterium nepalense TaxID=1854498 RepID=A0ABY4KAW4_9FLAO|nr:hypothetical protein [Chryseobacterium nepalense]UPQ77471.1 hypothetical protein M0D58_08030 [Chryseobacterium nepalense]
MEELKEELSKASSTVTSIVNEATNVVLERFKNPTIAAFTIPWIVINWRSILFFIFSTGSIEFKILYVNKYFSDYCHTLVYPLLAMVTYLFFLPYFNQYNELFIKKAFKKRADYKKIQITDQIERQGDIAIKINDAQKKIMEAREGVEHNQYVDELQTTIEELKAKLNEEQIKNINESKSFREQSALLSDEIKILNNKIISNDRKNLKELEELKKQLNDTSLEFYEATKKNKILHIEKILDLPNNKMFRFFEDGQLIINIFQYQDTDMVKYYDFIMRTFVSKEDVISQLLGRDFQVIRSGEEFDYATEVVKFKTLP